MQSVYLSHPFEPIVFSDTRLLILGSFPSKDSLAENFYYAHPRNQFWPILSRISGYPINNTDQKIWLLKQHRLGLWDMIATCRQKGSLDSTLQDETPNDIPALLERYPSISKIAFTGRKAQTLFEKHFGYLEIARVYLPSPSPAYAAMRMEEKAARYRELLGF